MAMRITLLLCLVMLSCGVKQQDEATDSANLARVIETLSPSPGWAGADNDDDFSLPLLEQVRKATDQQLQLLRSIDTNNLTRSELIDWQFAQSILVGHHLDQTDIQFWRKDPRYYMAFRNIGNLIGRPGEKEEKLSGLENKLRLVPIQLRNGMRQLEFFVPRFQELGLFMAENGRVLFNEEVPAFLEQSNAGSDQWEMLIKEAKESLEEYISFLIEELPTRSKADFAIGKKAYEQMLKERFLLDHDAESLWKFGWEQFRKTQSELSALAQTIDPTKSWQELIIEIKNDYPHPDSMIEAHQLWVDRAKAHILKHDLLPIPWDETVQVVPRAEYLRKTSYYGNFSSAKKADSDGVFRSKWMINPFEHQWDEVTKQQYLVEHDWGVIIVTAPHEAYAGHHVHGLYQLHNPSKLRRENGISLFSEGWGLYNEQLMQETGFFPDERIHLRQLQLRLWRNARVIYDVGLHTNQMNYEEAIQLMEDEVGFLRWAAQLEIDAATSRPGYFIGYFLGLYEILKMREDYKKKEGSNFSLKDFHVKLMKAGNMPTTLMRKAIFDP